MKGVIPLIDGILIRPKPNEPSTLPCQIVNTNTSELYEIKFNDETSRSDWLKFVDTNIRPTIKGFV